MGRIEGGSASGLLPNDRVFAVNFPGYPNSLARATQALGGEDRIAETRSAEGNYLELKFRPEDPCAHAAFGELSQTSDLLLRIRRKRRKYLPRSDEAGGMDVEAEASLNPNSTAGEVPLEDNAEDFETNADIVARVDNTYNFDGMADYQYVLSVHADVARRRQKRQREKQGLGNLMDVEQDELMMLVPPLFSIKDMPEETVLRPSDFVTKKTKRKNDNDTPVKPSANILPCFAVDFKIAEVPSSLKWEDQLVKHSMEYNLTAATVQLFQERPIWAKPTLLDRLAEFGVVIAEAHVKRLLFRTGYYFGYGPFRTLWIRNGYDPRRDPESRLYQMMDFRIPRTLRDGPERPGAKDSGPAWRDICTFKVAPVKRFSFLQLFDLQDDYIQAQIRKPPERPSCSEYTGWFRRSTLDQLRDHIRARFMGLMPDMLARELQGLPRQSWAPALKTVSWKDDVGASNNDSIAPLYDVLPAPVFNVVANVDSTGTGIQTPSELIFTPLPDEHSLQSLAPEPQPEPEPEPASAPEPALEPEPQPEIFENEDEIPGIEADLGADAAVAAEIQAEEDEEDEESDEDEEDDDEEDEEEEDEEEEEDMELPPQVQDGALEEEAMPDGFLKDLLKQFPFGQGYGEAEGLGGVDEDDAEYAIYEQADDEDDD